MTSHNGIILENIMTDFWLIATFAGNFGISFVGHRYKDKPFTRVENIIHSSTFACEQKRKVAILKQQFQSFNFVFDPSANYLTYQIRIPKDLLDMKNWLHKQTVLLLRHDHHYPCDHPYWYSLLKTFDVFYAWSLTFYFRISAKKFLASKLLCARSIISCWAEPKWQIEFPR